MLAISDRTKERSDYPTSRLQKGLLMVSDGQELAEEAVGFGVPLLKLGLEAVFPGSVDLTAVRNDPTWKIVAVYNLNLVEKIARPGAVIVGNRLFYTARDSLAALMRRFPPARGFLTGLSNRLREMFGWETTYEDSGFSAWVGMTYTFDVQTGGLKVEADLTGLPRDRVSEVIIMNEQGAQFFDEYWDSSGASLSGEEIGCWEEVTADEASFADAAHRIAFTVPRVAGARLFRGRELVGSRLAWSGFGYSLHRKTRGFSFTVRIDKLP